MPDLMTIAESWSFWDRPIPESIQRDVALPSHLSDRLCLVVQGVRRCGKSVLLQQLVGRFGLDPTRCLFVNFEDPRLLPALDHTALDGLLDGMRRRFPTGERTYFLDEIQGVAGWERWLRTRLERPAGDRFVITGSNAHLLSGELSSILTGRHLTLELYPFDFEELRTARPNASVADYLHWGGFPEPLTRDDGDRLLQSYFRDIVERDVRERVRARSSLPVRQVAQMVFESAGSELSLRRIAGAVGIAVETAASYVDALESAYLISSCPWFAWSERKRASRNKKYYPVDTGMRRVVSTAGGADRGKALECAVQLALRRRYREVYYWRDGGEVDFVVQTGDRLLPVQVSWDGVQDRHRRALEAFYERFPRAEEALFVDAEGFEGFLAGLG